MTRNEPESAKTAAETIAVSDAETLLSKIREENENFVDFNFFPPTTDGDVRTLFNERMAINLQNIINSVGGSQELLNRGILHICIGHYVNTPIIKNTFDFDVSLSYEANLRILCGMLKIPAPRNIADDVTEVAFAPDRSETDDDIQTQTAVKLPKTIRSASNTLKTTALAVGIAIASSGIISRNKPTDEIEPKDTDSHVYLAPEICQFHHSLDGFRASCETTIERDLTRAEASFDWTGKPYTDKNGNTMQNAKIEFTTPAIEDDMPQEHCESGEPILVKKNVPVGDIQKSEVTFVCKAQ